MVRGKTENVKMTWNFLMTENFWWNFFFNLAIKNIKTKIIFENKDLSWQEFIHDKIFLRRKIHMAKIFMPKIFMRKIFITAISITNF